MAWPLRHTGERSPANETFPFHGGIGRCVFRASRAVCRAALIVVWTVLAVTVQAICLLLPGRAKVLFPRFYWAVFTRLLGMRVRLIGAPANHPGGRPVVFVSNHSSWVDVPVLGGKLETCFISKEDVARWPLVSTVAKLGRTVFVSRQRLSTGRERDAIQERLEAGDNLVLFPEGTTSDGSRVLPFRSSFFAVAEGENPPLIQPVSVVYDRLAGLPTGRANRPLFAWYGDMDIASHFWRLVQHRGLRASVMLHPPLDPVDFPTGRRSRPRSGLPRPTARRRCDRTAPSGRQPRETKPGSRRAALRCSRKPHAWSS